MKEKICSDVNHPSHYNQGGVECIDAMEALANSIGQPDEAMIAGVLLRYLWRYNRGNHRRTCRKLNGT